jgi:hypothetical protein
MERNRFLGQPSSPEELAGMLKDARNAALEDAAILLFSYSDYFFSSPDVKFRCAAAIRALKEK